MGMNRLFAAATLTAFLFITYTATSHANQPQVPAQQSPPAAVIAAGCQVKLEKTQPLKLNEFEVDQTVVLDTNVLINDPRSFHSFGKAHVIIPITVLNELNKFKTDQASSAGRGAREFYRNFGKLMRQHPEALVFPTEGGGKLTVQLGGEIKAEVRDKLQEESNDAKIIQTAYDVKAAGKKVYFVTQDVDAFIKSRTLEIPTTKYIHPMINHDESKAFTGVSTIQFRDEEIRFFVDNGEFQLPLDLPLKDNQFVVMKSKNDTSTSTDLEDTPPEHVGRIRMERDEAGKVIRITMKKLVNIKEINFTLTPRNLEQHMLIDMLVDDAIPLKTAIGQAGSGKTLLIVAWAVWKVLSTNPAEVPMNVFITRPAVEMGARLGFLPGTADDKMGVYLDPFQDALETLGRIMDENKWRPRWQTTFSNDALDAFVTTKNADHTNSKMQIAKSKFPDGFFEDRNEQQQKEWLKAQRAKGNDMYQSYNDALKQIALNKPKPLNRRQKRNQRLAEAAKGQEEQSKTPPAENVQSANGVRAYWTPDRLMKEARIRNLPLQFIRGRSLSNTIILADEMQNDTEHVAKSLGTRPGTNSFLVMAGDPNQIDAMYLDRYTNGLSITIDRMSPSAASAHITLMKNERSFLSREVTKFFGDNEEHEE